MVIKPIHEISADQIELFLRESIKFIEWNIEPKYCHLEELIESIRQSLIYFDYLSDGENEINIYDITEITNVINTFTALEHPLKEGLIAIREIITVINTDQKSFDFLKIIGVINNFLGTIEPCVLKEKLDKYRLVQSDKGSKKRNVRGLTPEEREKRNNEIKSAFKKTKLKENSFCIDQGKKYGLSTTAIRNIIKP